MAKFDGASEPTLFRIHDIDDLGKKKYCGCKDITFVGGIGAGDGVTGVELLSGYNWAQLYTNCLTALGPGCDSLLRSSDCERQ